MAILTSVPQPVFGPTGFIAPAESVVLAGVLTDINLAFNNTLNLSLSTPQGQIASSETAIIGNANDTFCYLTNQMDPAYASGRMQDGIGRIYFITRLPALPTAVPCTCTGLLGTVIPAGSLATDGTNTYTCTDGGTIDSSGSISLTFANNTVGPIACPAGTLTQIYQAIPGWDTITNPSDGVLGQNTESRSQFETRRQESVAKNARGIIQAIQGAVLAVNGVLDAFSWQNDTASPVTYRGATIGANSVYVAAVGGADADVAQAIWSKKAPGAPYAGNTTIIVYDTNPSYTAPFPSYEVIFERPAALAISYLVQIANSQLVPANATTLIQNAIISAFAGGDGGPRARIGSTIFASRFIAPVVALGAWVQIVSLQIGSLNLATATVTGAIAATILTVSEVASGVLAPGQVIFGTGVLEGTQIVNQITGVNAASATGVIALTTMTISGSVTGAFAAGQVIHGTGVTPGTTIVAFLTGSGSDGTYQVSNSQTVSSTTISGDAPGTTGTYTLNNSQTVASEALTSVTANQNDITVNINQVPVTSPADITVGLVNV